MNRDKLDGWSKRWSHLRQGRVASNFGIGAFLASFPMVAWGGLRGVSWVMYFGWVSLGAAVVLSCIGFAIMSTFRCPRCGAFFLYDVSEFLLGGFGWRRTCVKCGVAEGAPEVPVPRDTTTSPPRQKKRRSPARKHRDG